MGPAGHLHVWWSWVVPRGPRRGRQQRGESRGSPRRLPTRLPQPPSGCCSAFFCSEPRFPGSSVSEIFLALFPPRIPAHAMHAQPRAAARQGRAASRPAALRTGRLGTSCPPLGDSVRSWGVWGGCPGPGRERAGGQGADSALPRERDEGCSEAAQHSWALLPRLCCEAEQGERRGLGFRGCSRPTFPPPPQAWQVRGLGAGREPGQDKQPPPRPVRSGGGRSWAQPGKCWLR